MAIFLKDPAAAIDYVVDWQADYLAGQTITASRWTVDPDAAGGLAVAVATHDGGRSTATLTGGTPGRLYRLTNQVDFSDGRRDSRTLDVRVEDR
ncbi:hypothetical protein [Polymorphobacter fuscus]|uniref:Uncharacterized protein n=1 Tax=Sandarakinorhabdus fusca TaxID=1439888 RepID=A0A7C9GSD1_9SPHN|nr:hypothetical protein [Polymorphobacter fuscus]KAB7648180.1 hypothetical protein F9290_00160 [Polymorphobacter fuscus]MQT15678.1 hypothetical protein [Polymorphobacter fuscus]NJC08051.1 hypothetical protein [Polymorphobacter fuscus]